MKKMLYGMLLFPLMVHAVLFQNSTFRAVDEDSSGNIYAAGYISVQGMRQWIIASFLSDGSRNTLFGSDGTGTSIMSTSGFSQLSTLEVVATDGSLMVAGMANQIPTISHFLSSGALDTSFGTQGLAQVAGTGEFYGMAFDASGNVVAVGTSIMSNLNPQVQVAYVTNTGAFQTGFGGSGVVQTAVGEQSYAYDAVVLSDGSIIVGGSATISSVKYCLLIKYNTDGSLDTSYGNQGIVTVFPSEPSVILSMMVYTDGTVYAAGRIGSQGVVLHFNTDGSVDTNFGQSGMVTITNGYNSYCSSLALTTSNQLLTTGAIYDECFAARFSIAGVLDTTFGSSGMFTLELINGDMTAQGIIDSNGNILTVGRSNNFGAVVRMTSTGDLDSSFGYNGYALLSQINNSTIRFSKLFDQEAVGTNGGTFTAGAWQTRTLNQLVGDRSMIALSSNQFTLQPGVYNIIASAPAYKVGSHQIKLYNVTDATDEAFGTTEVSTAVTSSIQTQSTLNHTVIISVPTTYQIQHYGSTTEANDGFGLAAGNGTNPEIYAQIFITQH